MKKTLLIAASFIFVVSLLTAAQAPNPAMQMALANMSKVMVDMDEGERMQYMRAKQREGVAHGMELFNDRNLGSNSRSCNNCHPGGTTTNGSTQIPMPLSNGCSRRCQFRRSWVRARRSRNIRCPMTPSSLWPL